MPKVFVLPDHLASQIAAGEVVERPSSVVKELTENAVDAGATQIDISISSDCRDIRIADNGGGMEAEDAVLAFHRHATSKLRSVEDLTRLHSLGFRGEALPSIASVARVSCYTRTHDAASGVRVDSADGKISTSETGCSAGTVMEITDLFYNVPARFNFLKKGSTEFGHIEEIVQSIAIAYPEVAIHLAYNGTTRMRTTGSGDLSKVISEAKLFTGRELLCEVSKAEDGVEIFGYVARPLHFRGDRKGILSIVNNRPVRCPLTYRALDYAFSDLIPRGRYPLGVIKVTIDPAEIDINIHPTKKEIKYSNGNAIYLFIQRALMDSLRQVKQELHNEQTERFYSAGDVSVREPVAANLSMFQESAEESQPQTSAELNVAEEAASVASVRENSTSNSVQLRFRDRLAFSPPPQSSAYASKAGTPGFGSVKSDPSFNGTDDGFNITRLNNWNEPETPAYSLPLGWRLAGYIHNTYILVETPDGLEIIEQHIAHERTLYERLLAQQKEAGRVTDHIQHLIVSVPLQLTPEQTSLLQQHHELLERFGFEFDLEELACTQVPLELAHKDYAGAIQDLLEQLSTADSANLDLEATKSIACQSAIKNGMPLSNGDIVKLIAEWYTTPRHDTCPHGRPVKLSYSIEKLFQLFHPA